MSEPLIIVGNGMAATRLVDELGQRALGRYSIAVIGDEPRLAYNRVLLSPLLAGEIAEPDIELKPAHWWRARRHLHMAAAPPRSIAPRGRSLGDESRLP